METITDKEPASKLAKKTEQLKAKFASNEDAITFYTNKLEQISANNNMSIEDMILASEKSAVFHDDYSEVLSLSQKIAFLRK